MSLFLAKLGFIGGATILGLALSYGMEVMQSLVSKSLKLEHIKASVASLINEMLDKLLVAILRTVILCESGDIGINLLGKSHSLNSIGSFTELKKTTFYSQDAPMLNQVVVGLSG